MSLFFLLFSPPHDFGLEVVPETQSPVRRRRQRQGLKVKPEEADVFKKKKRYRETPLMARKWWEIPLWRHGDSRGFADGSGDYLSMTSQSPYQWMCRLGRQTKLLLTKEV